uniref:HMG box domain-containing protein n=1 Tax=Oryza glumipatula TaxID=40148 RepID=A0A0E0AEN9_9ORYZ
MPLTSSSSYPLSSQPRFLLSSPLLFSSLVVWVCPCLPSPSSSPFPSSLPPSHKRESARLSPGEDSAMKGAKSKGAAKPDAKLAVKSKGAEKPAAKGRKGKAGKDPNKPKRAPSAFFVFMGFSFDLVSLREEFRKEFKEKNPKNKSVAAVGKAAGDRWKSLTEADKAPYVAKANKLKAEYNKAIAAYNKGESTAKKAPAKEEEEDDEEESDKSKSEVNDEDDDEGSEEDEDDDE